MTDFLIAIFKFLLALTSENLSTSEFLKGVDEWAKILREKGHPPPAD